jgi:hypothetical protein
MSELQIVMGAAARNWLTIRTMSRFLRGTFYSFVLRMSMCASHVMGRKIMVEIQNAKNTGSQMALKSARLSRRALVKVLGHFASKEASARSVATQIE